jgi:hypothetical protein
MDNSRLKELETSLKEHRNSESLVMMKEYLSLRYEEKKEKLVVAQADNIRGQAQELKSLLKLFSQSVDIVE